MLHVFGLVTYCQSVWLYRWLSHPCNILLLLIFRAKRWGASAVTGYISFMLLIFIPIEYYVPKCEVCKEIVI